MWKVLAASALILSAGAAVAQQRGYNPLDNFLNGLETRQGNNNMDCSIQHRLLRNGDLRELRITCYSDRRNTYGR